MLSSTNYDDTEERIVGGQNGLGAKLTNIFSYEFHVETIDASRKLIYKQKFKIIRRIIHQI
jgi:DNA topoisomerase-2